MSEANDTGFYGQARLDKELILSLPSDDVWVTSACIKFWDYEDVEDFVAAYNRNKISKGDIIYASDVQKNQSGYWYLIKYERVE